RRPRECNQRSLGQRGRARASCSRAARQGLLHPRARVRLDARRVQRADGGTGVAVPGDDRARREGGGGLMIDAPIAGWRRLFAIGGAPAASHATLSRAPASDRLLDPLARARVTDAVRLEALVRPLDIAGVLARVSPSASTTAKPEAADEPTGLTRRVSPAADRDASAGAD